MKPILAVVTTLAIAAAVVAPASAQTGISIGINQPGVYGRVRIGDVPPPALIRAEPVVVAPPPRVVAGRPPIYLYVPPAHQENWRRYCGRYDACGQPVYFVRDDWVRERYEHEHPGWDRGRHRGWDRHGDDHGRDNDHHHDRGRGHDRP